MLLQLKKIKVVVYDNEKVFYQYLILTVSRDKSRS